ncbi:spermatogenesis-associated protein 33 isoform X1 [Notamacropus eugenii]|uniref:spermatogenesis-associated protein 33 isoform X1 n=1 Tax=Notamacropus eugenii TaxID=9315 RepID=UPI003B66CCC4
MSPLMGLNKSKGSTDVSSSTVHKSKSKSKVRHVDKQSTSSRPSSISSASNTYGPVKTPMRSPRSINETVASKTPSSSIHKPMNKGQKKVPEKNQERLLERDTASSHLDSFSGPSDQEYEPKMFAIPQIVVTRASNEETASPDDEVQQTIRDKNDYSPYYRHRSPSTVDAYIKTEPEGPKTKSFL